MDHHQQQQQYHHQQQQQPNGADYGQQQHQHQQQFEDEYHHGGQYGDFDNGAAASSGPVKLFVGQVPRTMEEDDLRPVLEAFGPVEDLVIIRDKLTGAHRGCAFASFFTREAAEQAIAELHNKVTLPQSINPLQVRPAEGQAGGTCLICAYIVQHMISGSLFSYDTLFIMQQPRRSTSSSSA